MFPPSEWPVEMLLYPSSEYYFQYYFKDVVAYLINLVANLLKRITISSKRSSGWVKVVPLITE